MVVAVHPASDRFRAWALCAPLATQAAYRNNVLEKFGSVVLLLRRSSVRARKPWQAGAVGPHVHPRLDAKPSHKRI